MPPAKPLPRVVPETSTFWPAAKWEARSSVPTGKSASGVTENSTRARLMGTPCALKWPASGAVTCFGLRLPDPTCSAERPSFPSVFTCVTCGGMGIEIQKRERRGNERSEASAPRLAVVQPEDRERHALAPRRPRGGHAALDGDEAGAARAWSRFSGRKRLRFERQLNNARRRPRGPLPRPRGGRRAGGGGGGGGGEG